MRLCSYTEVPVLKSDTGTKGSSKQYIVKEIHSKRVSRALQREAIEDQSYHHVSQPAYYLQPEDLPPCRCGSRARLSVLFHERLVLGPPSV